VNATETFETVFKRADRALYNAKNNGRNQVQFAQP
jgi:PleD family two-component response regulator